MEKRCMKKNEMVHIESREETSVENQNADGDAQDKQTTTAIVTRNQAKKDNNENKTRWLPKDHNKEGKGE